MSAFFFNSYVSSGNIYMQIHWVSNTRNNALPRGTEFLSKSTKTCTQIIVFAVPDTGKVVLKMMSNQIHYSCLWKCKWQGFGYSMYAFVFYKSSLTLKCDSLNHTGNTFLAFQFQSKTWSEGFWVFFLPSYNIWAHLFQTLPGDPLVGINKVHCFHFSVWTFLAAHKSLCHYDFVLRHLWVAMCHEMTMLEVERNWKSCEGQQFFSLLHPQAKLFKISPAWSHFKVSHYFRKTPLPSMMIQRSDCSRLTANHHLAQSINLVRGLVLFCQIIPKNNQVNKVCVVFFVPFFISLLQTAATACWFLFWLWKRSETLVDVN